MADVQHHEEGLLGWLDGPRLAVGAFAIFIAALAVFGLVIWSDQREQVDRIDAIVMQRLEEEAAAKREQVTTCFSRAAQGPALRKVLLAVERGITDPADRQTLKDFRELSEINTPTVRECRQLARRLNVPAPKETSR